MAEIIKFSIDKNQPVDLTQLIPKKRSIPNGLINPSTNHVNIEVANDHTSEPIKSLDDINKISRYLIKNERFRDNMLFVVGINFGLRVSDLISLRFCQLINEDLSFKENFPILEKKTKNTRKTKKNRYITINDAVIEAIVLYLKNTSEICNMDDYIFRGESTTCDRSKHIHRATVDKILKGINNELHLNIKMSTHTLRKTFAYHQMVMSNNDPRKLLLLQKMFGHSTAAQTLDYIGITSEEIEDAYKNLNLGSENHYLIDSRVEETYVS